MEAIHFFRAGQHTTSGGEALTFSAADLAAIASSYSPGTHEAPLVVGHPKQDAPAFGWVDKVLAKPDGLYAVPREVNAEFSELVRKGSFKKVSGAFFPKTSKNNPTPGAYYLRHIGFLGAAAPAIKGLNPIQFADDEDLFFMEEDISDLREHRLHSKEQAFKRREIEYTIQRISREGHIPIGLVPDALTFCQSLADDEALTFSDSETKSQTHWFLEFCEKLPVPVVLGEVCKIEFAEDDDHEFDPPKGYTVDQRSAEIDRLARAHMKKNGGSYGDAVRIAEGRIPRT